MKINSKDIESIESIKNKIDANSLTNYYLDKLAREAGMGTTKFKYLFRQLYELGVFQYISDLRMTTAMELLANSDQPIKRIAAIAGYNHVSNFTAAFKKRFGVTPCEFRNTE